MAPPKLDELESIIKSSDGIFLYLASENQKEPERDKDIKRITRELDGKLAGVKICASKLTLRGI